MSRMVVNLSDMDKPSTTITDLSSRPIWVGFLLFDGFPLMSYASAMEPLRAANLLAGRTLYDICHLAISEPRIRSSSGAIIEADMRLADLDSMACADPDLLLVVAGGELSKLDSPLLSQALKQLAMRKLLLGGVSAGPVLLARAGIMTGRRMTVHWDHVQSLADEQPELIIERSLYVRDRDRLTCAGGTAPLDMMHWLINEHHGPVFARQVSDWFVQTDIRPAENAQRAGIAHRYDVTDTVVIQSIEAMENHLADPLELSQLASLAGLGARQLNRLFHQKLAISTIRFYRRLRLSKACELLTSTGWSLDVIASATGFANGAHLSRLFRERYGHSPTQHRQRVESGKHRNNDS